MNTLNSFPVILIALALVILPAVLIVWVILKTYCPPYRHPPQSGFKIQQVIKGDRMAITGIVVGATGVFTETPTPAGAVVPAGSTPQWSTSDPANTSLTPSTDGSSVSVAVGAGAPVGGSFNLTVANQDGTFPTTVAVPYLAPPPPAQTGFVVNQVS